MPNAKDLTEPTLHKFFVAGPIGTGKTAGFLTLPGKKFAYLFDPNAILTLSGHDVDYEEFLPTDLSLKITSLSKEQNKKLSADERPASDSGAELYTRWEEDFESKCASGFFDDYDCILFDSCTTFLDLIMDRILVINGRAGQWPNQDDYGPQMMTFSKIVKRAASLGKIIYFTAHTELKQDDVSKRVQQEFILTGRLKVKLPVLFSEVIMAGTDSDKSTGKSNYTIQTSPDREFPNVRCTLKQRKFKENVTIDWTKDPVGQGLGGLYFGKTSRG